MESLGDITSELAKLQELTGEDYDRLIAAARKAVEHGYTVYMLPNPKGMRSADFIFERKGTYKIIELKTILGRSSARTSLISSIGQTNRVLLNMATNYSARRLASDVKAYFEANRMAKEVIIFKGKKIISVKRLFCEQSAYFKKFCQKYEK